jgi:hypothetical protein
MGYNIHITRRPDWSDRTDKIAYEEWRRVAEADPDFEVCGSSGDRPLYTLRVPADPTFYYSDAFGDVLIRGAYGLPVWLKIIEVARKLGAVVRGDEGESYRLTERGVEKGYEQNEDPGWELYYEFETAP